MIHLRDESLFSRSQTANPASHRCGEDAGRSRRNVRGLNSDDQTLSQGPKRNRASRAKGDSWAACGERSRVAGPLAGAVRGSSRCETGRTLPPVCPGVWHHRQSGLHQPCQNGFGLDAKKKTLRASEQDETARAAWREQAKQLPTADLVVVDETGSRINMTPLYAYAPRGERAIGKVPRNYGANLTLIASLSLEGMGEAMLLDGSADEMAFEAYVEQFLAPSLRPGQIVILDNLSIHRGPRVQQAIEARGCQLLFLPSYSPDFSPIEGAFSKLKATLRRAQARTRDALQEAIIQALPSITAQDALGWFLHCGYSAPETRETAQHL
jgi:transposase